MFDILKTNLESLGYKVSCFEDERQAAQYLNREIDGVSVGIGGSVTIDQMDLYPMLSTHNDVYWHWSKYNTRENTLENASRAQVYISSVNGIAQTGEIINIDGTCNRVSATLYGHSKVYFVVGKNKVAPDFESALFRARNIAAPMNAKRLNRKTPCVSDGVCHNCKSPERICRSLNVLWTKPRSCEFEVVLIDRELGY